MDIEHAKTIPVSVILDKLGKTPQRTNGRKNVYFSPFRDENTPSLWEYLDTNTWRDFGDSKWKGGDTIRLVQAWLDSTGEHCTVSDALRWLRNMTDYIPRIKPVPVEEFRKHDTALELKDVTDISEKALFKYGESRGIPPAVLQKHLKQIAFFNRNSGKTFYTLGLKNESDGYEARASFFKGTVKSKDITFVRGTVIKPSAIHVFEGMMDFLSVITQREGEPLDDDAIILNSLNLLDQGSAYIRKYGYTCCYTWMDNDDAGIKATRAWQEFCRNEENLVHVPMNESYTPHKDVNAHHMAKLEL